MKACVLIVWEAGKPTSQVWAKADAEAAGSAFKAARTAGKTAQLFLHMGPGDKRCRAVETPAASVTPVAKTPKAKG